MAERSIRLVKKAIYTKLNTNATLVSLIGADAVYYHLKPEKATYPCVVYSIISESDAPFNEDSAEGKLSEVLFTVSSFSDTPGSEEADSIETAVRKALHGQTTLETTDIMCYSCFKQYSNQRYDSNAKVWITTTTFRLLTAPKA